MNRASDHLIAAPVRPIKSVEAEFPWLRWLYALAAVAGCALPPILWPITRAVS